MNKPIFLIGLLFSTISLAQTVPTVPVVSGANLAPVQALPAPSKSTVPPTIAPQPNPVAPLAAPTVAPAISPVPEPLPAPVVVKSDALRPKHKYAFGLLGLSYFEINSEFDSLYFDFPNDSHKTAGFGFLTTFELGLDRPVSGEIALGYSRLTYADDNRSTIKENYFVGDFTAHFNFYKNNVFAPYLIGGLGVYASSGFVAPLADLGIGTHFYLTESLSLKAEILYKTAVVLNRGEARFGFAYHF